MTEDQYKPLAFISTFKEIQQRCHTIAKSKGWWEDKSRSRGEMIALMHSELSEALEFLRHDNPKSDHIPEFSGVEEELADVIIRIMDMAEADGLQVASAVIAKTEFNARREHKHGGKKF